MRVIAQSESWYLLDLEDGRGQGRILDLEFRRLFAPMQLVALLSRGGWEDFDGDQDQILSAAETVEEIDASSAAAALHQPA